MMLYLAGGDESLMNCLQLNAFLSVEQFNEVQNRGLVLLDGIVAPLSDSSVPVFRKSLVRLRPTRRANHGRGSWSREVPVQMLANRLLVYARLSRGHADRQTLPFQFLQYEHSIAAEIQKFDHPTRASFGEKIDGVLDCFRSGGMPLRNEFATRRLGDFYFSAFGEFSPSGYTLLHELHPTAPIPSASARRSRS